MRKAAIGIALLVLAPQVFAATVSILGTGILFEASNGEKNTVLLQGAVVDEPILGDGFLIVDSTGGDILTSGQGCRASGNRVSCAITPAFVKLELRDENDSVITQVAVRMIVNGGKGNDVITGSNADDDLDGDRDNDTIDGRGGNDEIRGGFGDDTLTGGLGDDDLIGSLGGDTLDGGPGLDQFDAGSGKDIIRAQDGVSEKIRCGGGNDTVTKDANDETSRCR